VIKLGDPALVLIFLSQGPPAADDDGSRARQTDLRKCHEMISKFWWRVTTCQSDDWFQMQARADHYSPLGLFRSNPVLAI
jgi:hypothetical protein